QTLQEKDAKSADKLVSFGGARLTEVAQAIFDLIVVFVLSVYMLLYGPRIGALVRRAMPAGDGTHEDDYPWLVQRAVSRYVGGQLLFSTIMGASAGLGLYLFGVLVIFALLLGLTLYGVIGALVALPVAAVLRETAVYLSRHLTLESWERSPRGLL